MNDKDFDKIVDKQLTFCQGVLSQKAEEYATEDRLHNFKIAAEVQHILPRQALAGMMAKHTVSIYDMCMCNACFTISLWEEKITDHINYLILLKALIMEENLEISAESDFRIIDGNGNAIDLEL
jgi:hypothetical protein